jgi:hypothetical protein
MNKVEQVVGRASRHCSHAELPPAKRNVTIFLHAAVDPADPRKETIDLRAYRIAELKQERIERVERVLRDNSIDCALNLPRLHFDRDRLDMRIDLTTSQGTAVRGYRLGDDPSGKPVCRVAGKPRALRPDASGPPDTSTYDSSLHAYHGAAYRRSIRSMFARAQKATYDEVWRFVATEMPDARRELLNAALDDVVRGVGGEIVRHADGRRGRLVYRANAYLFQPDDEDTELLTDVERARHAAPFPKRLTL